MSTGNGERRAYPRYPVMWTGSLSDVSEFDSYVLDCRIQNVSISGVHVLVDRTMAVDSAVTLRIGVLGEFRGTVVWTEGNAVGVRFDESPEQVAKLIKDRV